MRAFVGVIGVSGMAVAACLTATTIDVRVYTEVPCGQNAPVAIVVAADEVDLAQRMNQSVVSSSQSGCAGSDGYVGDLVLLPETRDEQRSFAVETRLDGQPPDGCSTSAPDAGCIVSKWSVSFLPHQKQVVRVDLRDICAGVLCPIGQTCVQGACVSDAPAGGCAPLCNEGSLGQADPGDMRGLQQGAPWPMVGRTPNHTSQTPYVGPKGPRLAWSLDLGGQIASPPSVGADGTIYTAPEGGNGHLYASTPAGGMKWALKLPGDGHRTPALAADGTIYVGTEAGLVAVTPAGVIQAMFPNGTRGSFYAGASIAPDGTVYQSTIFGGVVALTHDLTLVWNYAMTHSYSSATFGRDGLIYAGSEDEKSLFALNHDGTLKWRAMLGDQAFPSPSLAHDGTAYIGAQDGKLYAVGPDGSIEWTVATGAPIAADAAIGGDGNVTFGSLDGNLYSVTAQGALRWKFTAGAGVESNALVDGEGTVYAAADDGVVYALRPDGSLAWSYAVPPGSGDAGALRLFGPSMAADGTLYYGTSDGRLIALGP